VSATDPRLREEPGWATVVVPGVETLSSSARTLKHNDTFALLDEFGDICAGPLEPAGLFHKDTRHLSRLELKLEGHRPLLLASTVRTDNVVLDVNLTNPDFFAGGELVLAKEKFHIARALFLWEGACCEHLAVTSYAAKRRRLRLTLEFDADFTDIFEIRGFRRDHRGPVRAELATGSRVVFRYEGEDGVVRTTQLTFAPAPARLMARRAEFELELEPHERYSLDLTIQCSHGAARIEGVRRFGPTLRSAKRARAARRRQAARIETSNETVNAILSRSASDLALLVTDTAQGGYPYAGLPWFSTVFGRDGLITAMQMLWLDPDLARGVLLFLAAHQGARDDPGADEEPGKILHELREGELARIGAVPFGRYFGSIDSTPLFVALAGMYWQRTRDRRTIEALWPHLKAALRWIDHRGDRDGDGFVEYARMRETGLRNQGWKDSDDAIFHEDGSLAAGSIALCEVQGYVHLARTLAAELAFDLGETADSRELLGKAEALRAAFDRAYWCDSIGSYALALDGEKRPCRVRASNAAQLLYTDIVRRDRIEPMVRQLFGRAFFTGWGVRTVAEGEPRYNPTSYHNGSVWPHDNALIALGLARQGRTAEAVRLATALFDAAARMPMNRLPELYCGFPRRAGKEPVLYPVACVPQAWSACAPPALLQACLGIEIDAESATLVMHRPRLPPFLDWVNLRGLRVAEAVLDVGLRREGDTVAVTLLEREGEAEVQVVL
jgi:glycogen debranching enzyme